MLPLWTDAYLGDTTHLTTIEHGAYLLLLITMWRVKGDVKSLPDDDKLLARYTKLSPQQWKRMRPVIEPFFEEKNGRWFNGRLTDEYVSVKRHSKKQSNAAKARWLKTKKTDDATGMPDECQTDAPIPIPIPNTKKKKTSSKDDAKKRGSRIPENWQPDEADIAYAKSKGFSDRQILNIADGFRDYWVAKTGKDATKRDWSATWRGWVRNDITFHGAPDQRPGGNGRPNKNQLAG